MYPPKTKAQPFDNHEENDSSTSAAHTFLWSLAQTLKEGFQSIVTVSDLTYVASPSDKATSGSESPKKQN
jgi:hypothetical protein